MVFEHGKHGMMICCMRETKRGGITVGGHESFFFLFLGTRDCQYVASCHLAAVLPTLLPS